MVTSSISLQILSYIQQKSNDFYGEIPPLFDQINSEDVYVSKSLFTNDFFEEFLSLVKYAFDNTSADFINLSELGFVHDWQSILDFFVIPKFCNIFLGAMNLYQPVEGTFTINKYSANKTDDYKPLNSDNSYNILMPLTSGGAIIFKRYSMYISFFAKSE